MLHIQGPLLYVLFPQEEAETQTQNVVYPEVLLT